MDQKSNVSSDFFFHFTNKIEYIVDMVLNGFKPFYCPEMLEYFSKDELNTIQLAYPVICFCDIPLKLQKKHKKRFGGYGIGLKKKWGLDNYLTPVIYSHKNAVTSGVLKNFIDIYNIINDDTKKNGLSEEDFKNAVPFSALPESLQTTLLGLKEGRGKQQAPTKVSTTVRFDSDVLAAFRATGRGWQTRMNNALKDWLRENAA